MTREEEKLKAADEYIKNRIKEGQGRTGYVFPAFIEGIEWADANPDRNTFACISLISAEQAKKQMIDRACSFLKSYRQETPDGMGYIAGIVNDKTIEDFRKAMQDFTPNASQKP